MFCVKSGGTTTEHPALHGFICSLLWDSELSGWLLSVFVISNVVGILRHLGP